MATSPASEPPKRRNLGGLARKITMSLAEQQETVDRAFELGVSQGEDNARRLLREEIRQELQDELVGSPGCPLCVTRRDLRAVNQRLAITQLELQRERHARRGWQARDGRYRYKGTVADADAPVTRARAGL